MNGWVVTLAVVGGVAVAAGVIVALVAIYGVWRDRLLAASIEAVCKDLAKKGLLREVSNYCGTRFEKPYSHPAPTGPTWNDLATLRESLEDLVSKATTKKKDKA